MPHLLHRSQRREQTSDRPLPLDRYVAAIHQHMLQASAPTTSAIEGDRTLAANETLNSRRFCPVFIMQEV